MNHIKIFDSSSPTSEIRNYFKNEKRPFIVRKAVNSKIDLNFLSEKYKNENVLSLNPNSDKEHIKVSKLIQKIKSGQKYRLRANTKLGNKLIPYIDTSLINKLRENKKNFFDYFLSHGKTSRQNTLFLSTKNCTFTKHAHIISGLITHLEGEKTWYVSKSRENFFSIKFKNLLYPNPLYVTDKDLKNEISFTLNPGDMLYMPAYWFHYTVSKNTNLSYSYFFTETVWYYLSKCFLMFIYQTLSNPLHALIKAIKKEPEEHIYDRKAIVKRCKKINNVNKRNEALKFFHDNDYS